MSEQQTGEMTVRITVTATDAVRHGAEITLPVIDGKVDYRVVNQLFESSRRTIESMANKVNQ